MMLYLSIWFHLCNRILVRRIKNDPLLIIALSILIVWSIVGISLVYINLSRASILLASGSILLYLDRYKFDNKKDWRLVLLFLFACLIRVSSGTIVLAACSVFLLILFRNLKQTAGLIKSHWLIVIVCTLIVHSYKYTVDNPGLEIEQTYEYAMQDRGDVIPISAMKSYNDSIRYIAVTEYFLITDSAKIKLNFVKSLADMNRFFAYGITGEDISHLREFILPLMDMHKVIFCLLYALLFIASFHCSRRTTINLVGINAVGWAVIILLTMKVNMVDHFLLPWITMLLAISLVVIGYDQRDLRTWQKICAPMLLIAILIVNGVSLRYIPRQEAEYNKAANVYLENLDALSQKATPILWDYDRLFLPSEVLFRDEHDPLKSCIYETTFLIMYYKFAQERCLAKFGCSPLDYRGSCMSFHKNHDRIKFVANEKFASFIEKYYKALYDLDFKLIKDIPITEITPGNFVYQLAPDSTSFEK
jgi:hypothetical protein